MVDRGRQVPALLEVDARAAVHLALQGRVGAVQLCAQHLDDERVQPEVLLGAVGRAQRRGRAPQLEQHLSRVSTIQHRVAHRPGERGEDRGLGEEGQALRRQVREQLGPQVVGDRPVVARELRHRTGDVALGADRDAGEAQPGRPTLGPRQQRVDVGGVQAQARPLQQQGRLAAGHRQILGVELQHRPRRAQAPERRGRRAAARQHERHGGRQLPLGGFEGLRGDRTAGDVGVVDHEHRRRVPVAQGGHRVRQIFLGLGRRGPVAVEGHPGDRAGLRVAPGAQQRRLAVAGGRAQDHGADLGRGQQAPHEAGARLDAPSDRRRRRMQQRHGSRGAGAGAGRSQQSGGRSRHEHLEVRGVMGPPHCPDPHAGRQGRRPARCGEARTTMPERARSRPDDAAKADVGGRGVDGLRLARGGPVAQAVVGRAQVRAALDHAARDTSGVVLAGGARGAAR
jgi:hypothetical protein